MSVEVRIPVGQRSEVVFSNPGNPPVQDGAAQPMDVTTDRDGKTLAAKGVVPGTSVVFNNPGRSA